MPLISSSIPNLINGVSQQPAPTRLRTSCEAAENAYMSVVSGLQKRPNTEFLAQLNSSQTTGSDTAVHVVKKSADNKFVIVATDGNLEVFDTQTGTSKPVTFTGGSASYLNCNNPAQDLSFVTVADTTFVTNKTVTVTASTPTDTRTPSGDRVTVVVKRSVPEGVYTIKAKGNTTTFQLAAFITGDNRTDATVVEGTAEIARELTDDLNNNYSLNAVRHGNVITFDHNSTLFNTYEVNDEFGGQAMQVFRGQVNQFSDLPAQSPEGRLVRVIGTPESDGDDYYVQFNDGVWKETVAHGQAEAPDASTMPHVLVDNGSSFEFKEHSWGSREAGDSNSNASPTFVGNTINHVFLYKGRMGILSDENLIMSETADFENFYRTTATQIIDTDRIDVASNTGRVNILRHASAFGNNLVLFSDKQQFKVTEGDTLTPNTIGIQPTTAYDNSIKVSPVAAGPNVFFAVDGPNYALIRELFITNDTEQYEAVEVTVQVPKYIPTNIAHLAVSSYEDIMVAVSANERDTMYIYKWFQDGKTRVQSSWSKWTLDQNKEIIGLDFLDQDMVIVYRQSGNVYIDTLRVEETVSVATDAPLLLDSKVPAASCTKVYDAGTDTTTITLPYSTATDVQFWRSANPYGEQLVATKVTDNQYTVAGDETATDWSAGIGYEFMFELSEQYNRAPTDGGEVAVQDGRLQLRYMSVIYQNSSFFEAEVQPKNRDPRRYTFNGRVFADAENVLDTMPFDTGEFRFPITAQNNAVTIKLKSDKPFACAFGSAEWDAMYYPRTQRI